MLHELPTVSIHLRIISNYSVIMFLLRFIILKQGFVDEEKNYHESFIYVKESSCFSSFKSISMALPFRLHLFYLHDAAFRAYPDQYKST